MNRSRLLLGVAGVLAGTAVLLVVLGTVFNLVFVPLALPFGVAAYVLWYDASGRLGERLWGRTRHRRRRYHRTTRRWADGGSRHRAVASPASDRPSRSTAREVLGVDADAGEEAIRRAYRERVKDVHPDTASGDEEAFKRLTRAYDRLLEE